MACLQANDSWDERTGNKPQYVPNGLLPGRLSHEPPLRRARPTSLEPPCVFVPPWLRVKTVASVTSECQSRGSTLTIRALRVLAISSAMFFAVGS